MAKKKLGSKRHVKFEGQGKTEISNAKHYFAKGKSVKSESTKLRKRRKLK